MSLRAAPKTDFRYSGREGRDSCFGIYLMSTLKTTQMHGVENHRVHFYESHITQTKVIFFPLSLQLYFNSCITVLPKK